jgi:UDP-N-acetylglucosamine 2-epimerase (non-hydrolysing)
MKRDATNLPSTSSRPRVIVVLGTRPEAVKLFPVIRELRDEPALDVKVVVTGQHRELVDEILRPLAIVPDHDLALERSGSSLNELVAAIVPRLERMLDELAPPGVAATVVVQGDTTSAFCAALAAFHRRIAVAHVEAGLRSFDPALPFPEEANRRMVAAVASLHFAPTAAAQRHLEDEGIARESILVTGNTAVDALLHALERGGSHATAASARAPQLLVTLHRRESWLTAGGATPPAVESIFAALRDVAQRRPDATVLFPVHPNPELRERAERLLGDCANVRLLRPQPYFEFVKLLASSSVVLTDSGGIQEEAPSLGVPVLVARDVTERPEGIEAGCSRLVGTQARRIERELLLELARPLRARGRVPLPSPYGDGRAARRIREALVHRLLAGPRPEDFHPELALAAAAAR